MGERHALTGEPEEHTEEIINYFAISLFGQNTEDEVLWDLARNCISRLGFEDCVIYLVDERRRMLVQKAAYGPKNPKDFTIHQPLEIAVGKGIVGSVALSGVAEIIGDTSEDPRYIQDDAFRYSEICVPIVLEEKVIGVIDSENTERNFFTGKHLNALRLIASLCANKLIRARAETERRGHEKMLHQAQHELSRLSLKALRAQMNPHFIFNALNAIQYFITEKQSTEAMKYLSLFSRFIRTTLETSDQLFLSLANEIEILETYLKLERMRFNQRFDFSISVNPAVDIYNSEIPVLLVQPFVERVLTESVLTQKGGGTLHIDFDQSATQIACTIRSNGAPLSEPVTDSPSSSYPAESWWGIQERIQLIGRLFKVSIQVERVGSRIKISIPLQQEDNPSAAHRHQH
ncbi:MAG TPA: histidine kinase [Cyclobacteriaceae bacterium]